MGFFGKLFEKKQCDICGGEIGLLGNRKLEDGNLCKDCAKKLSPWFDERRHSTVEQIAAQLSAREENKDRLQSFHHAMEFGEYSKMYIELCDGVPSRFVVSSSSDYKAANADILEFSMVSCVTPDIRENRSELKRTNSQGEKVSYDPPRYEYRYDFYVKLDIQGCPYIDDLRFRLNRSTVELETVMPTGRSFSFHNSFDPMLYPQYRQYKSMVDELCEVISFGQRGVALGGSHPVAAPVATVRQSVEPVAAAVPAPAGGWVCEACGTENEGKFCQGCGTARPAPVKATGGVWTCLCGTQNSARFCQNCGKRFDENDLDRL